MTEPDPAADGRHLRTELERLREQVQHTRDRLGDALAQVAELRRRRGGGALTSSPRG